MAADDFFSRWSRRKSQLDHADDTQSRTVPGEHDGLAPASTPASHPEEPLPAPTIDEVAHLTNDSDFSRFVQRDVDEAVKRSALKKLFSNPHFNVMDGLDIYIDDYNKFTPMTPALLASLNHAKDLLNPPGLKKAGEAQEDARDAGANANRQPDGSDDINIAAEQPERQAKAGIADAEPLQEAEKTDATAGPDAAVSRDTDAASGTNDYDKSSLQGGS